MKLKPLGDRVLVKPDAREEKVGDIYLPEQAQKMKDAGKVLAAGPDARSVSVGAVVLLPAFGGTELALNGVKHRLIRECEILGVLE